MDSPPECVLALTCEPPLSPPTMPSLDHSPQQTLPHSPQSATSSPIATPYQPLSPLTLPMGNHQEDEEEDGELSAPPSPTPAVALFPGGEELCSPSPESSPPATPSSAPLPSFGALELALSTGSNVTCSEELDLQLFHNEGVAISTSGPTLKYKCQVCGKRFRFQSILSLHARAHVLDRDRRVSALYQTTHLQPQQNHSDNNIDQNFSSRDGDVNQRSLPELQNLSPMEDTVPEEPLQIASSPQFLLDESTPLTPPLTEEAPITARFSPLGPIQLEDPTPSAAAPSFRCHACKGKFRTALELSRHVRILHNPYKCTLCSFSASQEEQLALHLQESHPLPETSTPPVLPTRPVTTTPDKPSPQSPALPAFRCETCGQRFTQSWFLKGHMRKHKDSLDHKCQVCGRGFKEPWFLKNHMKVHLNKLGLKAGLGNLRQSGVDSSKGTPATSQALGALYSNLFLARDAAGGVTGRSERETSSSASTSKASILGYLGLLGDGSGGSCMERLQAVAQVAEMGNGERRGTGGGEVSDGGADQAVMWQLVAHSLAAAQQNQQTQRSQNPQQSRTSRSSVAGEAEQVRAYLGGLGSKEDSEGAGAPWECPDCGKMFRSLQQVVAHARVHIQRPQKGSRALGGAGRDEESLGRPAGGRGGEGSGAGRRGTGNNMKQEHKQLLSGMETAGNFHTMISHLAGENGLREVTSGSSGDIRSAPRERVRGTGVKDCPYCGKSFRSSHHLKVHLRVHTGERPYKCPHCDYAGTQSGSLKYHLQRHHREQRNAMATSPTTGSLSLTGPSQEGGPKKRRPPALAQGSSLGRASGEGPGSRQTQPPWPIVPLEHTESSQKPRGAQREAELESQYGYLSGMLGALYPARLEGGWTRETPHPKIPKVSRRKPLSTSRMVSSNGYQGLGLPRSAQEGGFEPLDLSRRPLADSDASMGKGSGGVPRGSARGDVTLNQCVFCPFRTSSAELMAMHIQVNHTSKSRRKRGASIATGEQSPRPIPLTSDRDPLALWRFISDGDGAVTHDDWVIPRRGTESSSPSGEGDLESLSEVTREANPTLQREIGLKAKEVEEEEEDEEEGEEEEEVLEGNGSPGDYPGLQNKKMGLSGSPGLGSEGLPRVDEGLVGN